MTLPPTTVADHARPLGDPPYASPGDAVMWTYRPIGWAPDRPAHVFPMRAVRDDRAGLVAWLAPGTSRLEPRDVDGAGARQIPLPERMHPDRYRRSITARVRWRGPGILRIAPTGRPWSVWLFWDQDRHGARAFAGWYVNLENAAQREGSDLITTDHVLDLWIRPDGTVTWKDEDELAAAVDQGRYTSEEADSIRVHGQQALEEFSSGAWMFAEHWTQWEPHSGWSIPLLPADAGWQLDQTGG